MDATATYVAEQAAAPSTPAALRPLYHKMGDLYERKLWYQLTLAIEHFLLLPEAADPPARTVSLYTRFVAGFEGKINQLRRAQIAVRVVKRFPRPAEARVFLAQQVAAVKPASLDEPESRYEASAGARAAVNSPFQQREAYILLSMEAAHLELLHGNLLATKQAMDDSSALLAKFDAVDPAVYGAFYRVAGDYHKAKAEYAPYYKNSLLYLACVNVDTDLTSEDKVERAHDLAIAALLSDAIYNFGELLLHPIVAVLQGTPHALLVDLLSAYNAGDLAAFESHLPKAIASEPILGANVSFLRQKMCLMALIESVFTRSPEQRAAITFASIARETRLPLNEVEHLVMKALSLHLIRGTMDQVDATIRVDWVQPRVLDRAQIDELRARLATWCDKVETVSSYVKDQTAPELLGAA